MGLSTYNILPTTTTWISWTLVNGRKSSSWLSLGSNTWSGFGPPAAGWTSLLRMIDTIMMIIIIIMIIIIAHNYDDYNTQWSVLSRSKYMGVLGRLRFARKPICVIGEMYKYSVSIHHNCCRQCLWCKNFHVKKFCSTWQCCLSCGSKFLHMTINFTPRDKIACRVEQFYHVKEWEIAPHL